LDTEEFSLYREEFSLYREEILFLMGMNREIYFMEDRFIEDEIESAIKKY